MLYEVITINNPKLDRGDFIFVSRKMLEKETTAAVQSAPETAVVQSTPQAPAPSVVEGSDLHLASIPPTVTATQDALKRGLGPFVLGDFENQA